MTSPNQLIERDLDEISLRYAAQQLAFRHAIPPDSTVRTYGTGGIWGEVTFEGDALHSIKLEDKRFQQYGTGIIHYFLYTDEEGFFRETIAEVDKDQPTDPPTSVETRRATTAVITIMQEHLMPSLILGRRPFDPPEIPNPPERKPGFFNRLAAPLLAGFSRNPHKMSATIKR